MERTAIIIETVESVIDNFGHAGQVGIVALSVGMAIWQILLIAGHLLFSGKSYTLQIYSNYLM